VPIVRRPAAPNDVRGGVLSQDHFQVAYATNDIERAQEIFIRRYGIKEYGSLDGELPSGGHICVKLAWVGGTMIELVQASGPGSAFVTSVLPPDRFAIRHHHLGYFVEDQSRWDAVQHEFDLNGWRVAMCNVIPGFLRVCYVEAPELGHYLEYIYPEPAGIAFFEGVPVS
jgi:Glyoxalase/Bleomycin resistance protein/Dioxygenase superfamily